MGGAISSAKRMLCKEKEEMGFLVLGLDAAGKTTMLYKLRLGEVVTTIPTIGFNIEHVNFQTSRRVINFTCWDVGGRDKIRPLWRHYYTDQSALIFVVDCNDRDRMEQAKDSLEDMLTEEKLQGKPLLVFANKQDLPNAMPASQVIEELGLHRVRTRPWFVQASVATTGDGLFEGLDWLSKAVQGQVAHASSEVASKVASAQAGGLKPSDSSLPVGAGAASAVASLKEGSDGGFTAETASTADTEPAEEGDLAVSTTELGLAEEGDLAVII